MRESGATADPPARARDAVALAALALVLGMFRIGHKSMWYDETVSADYAGRSPAALMEKITGGDPNMAFYYVMLALWRRVFGESEIALRSLSAVAGAGVVVAVYLLGNRLFGRRAGLFAGFLVAMNAFMIEYAQMARGYSLVACLVALSCWLFVVELERAGHPERAPRVEGPAPNASNGARVAFVLVSALAVYTHYFAALVLLAQLVTFIALRHRHAITPARIAMVVAIVALCLPALVFMRAGGTIRIDWIAPLDASSVPSVFRKLAGRNWPLAAIGLLSVATAVWQLVLGRQPNSDARRVRWLGFVLAWLVVPIVVAFLVSLRRPIFLAQYLIVCLPALALLMAAMLDRIMPARLGLAALGLCAMFSAWRLLVLYRLPGEEDWRGTEAYVAREKQPTDRIVFFPAYVGTSYDYYARVNHRPVPRSDVADSARRIWLVIRDFDVRIREAELAQTRAALGVSRTRSERARFPEISVELFERTR